MSYKSVKDLITKLTENGFRFVRQKGSHKGIEKGTYYNILRQAGLK